MTEENVKTFGEKLDSFLDKVSKLFSKEEVTEDKTELPTKTELEIANEKITALQAEIDALKTANDSEKASLEAEKTNITTLKQSLTEKETEAKALLTELQGLKNDWKPESRSHGSSALEGAIDKDGIRELRKKANPNK